MLGSFVAVDIEKLWSGKWSSRVFILVPFDVAESCSKGLALMGDVADGYIHVAIVARGVVGSKNVGVTDIIDICDNSLIVAEALEFGTFVFVRRVAGDVISEKF